jgi:hypothetical protein
MYDVWMKRTFVGRTPRAWKGKHRRSAALIAHQFGEKEEWVGGFGGDGGRKRRERIHRDVSFLGSPILIHVLIYSTWIGNKRQEKEKGGR